MKHCSQHSAVLGRTEGLRWAVEIDEAKREWSRKGVHEYTRRIRLVEPATENARTNRHSEMGQCMLLTSPMACLVILLAGVLLAGASAAATNHAPLAHLAREDIEWLDVWLPNSNDDALPRVLLIGDSITRAYGSRVESLLKGTAYVGRLATSKSLGDPAYLEQVALILREQTFDAIHFNNGLHGEGYTEVEYAAALPKLLTTLRRFAPHSRLMWASSTDVRTEGRLDQFDAFNDRVLRRNAIAAEICARKSIPIDDLYVVVQGHPEFHVKDGVHFTEAGIAAEADQVAAKVRELLSGRLVDAAR